MNTRPTLIATRGLPGTGKSTLARYVGVSFTVVDLTDVPVAECLRRNALRDGDARIPEHVITDMWERYLR